MNACLAGIKTISVLGGDRSEDILNKIEIKNKQIKKEAACRF